MNLYWIYYSNSFHPKGSKCVRFFCPSTLLRTVIYKESKNILGEIRPILGSPLTLITTLFIIRKSVVSFWVQFWTEVTQSSLIARVTRDMRSWKRERWEPSEEGRVTNHYTGTEISISIRLVKLNTIFWKMGESNILFQRPRLRFKPFIYEWEDTLCCQTCSTYSQW